MPRPGNSCISGTQESRDRPVWGVYTGFGHTDTVALRHVTGIMPQFHGLCMNYRQSSRWLHVNRPSLTALLTQSPKDRIGCTSVGPIDIGNAASNIRNTLRRGPLILPRMSKGFGKAHRLRWFRIVTTRLARHPGHCGTAHDCRSFSRIRCRYRITETVYDSPILAESSSSNAAFYRNCNMEYTDATALQSPSSAIFNEAPKAAANRTTHWRERLSMATNGLATLTTMVTNHRQQWTIAAVMC